MIFFSVLRSNKIIFNAIVSSCVVLQPVENLKQEEADDFIIVTLYLEGV